MHAMFATTPKAATASGHAIPKGGNTGKRSNCAHTSSQNPDS
jgi:hypothetical protein